jgi:hypothetical protein
MIFMSKHEFEGIVKRVEWRGKDCIAIYAERKPEEPQMFLPISGDHSVFDPLIGKKVKVIMEEVRVS